MDEYILRESALACCGEYLPGSEHIAEDIRQIPAADVVEVVRCEKCKFWDRKSPTEFKSCKKIATSLVGGIATRGEFYCEAGERKEENDEPIR